jgi:hypothetical protein
LFWKYSLIKKRGEIFNLLILKRGRIILIRAILEISFTLPLPFHLHLFYQRGGQDGQIFYIILKLSYLSIHNFKQDKTLKQNEIIQRVNHLYRDGLPFYYAIHQLAFIFFIIHSFLPINSKKIIYRLFLC